MGRQFLVFAIVFAFIIAAPVVVRTVVEKIRFVEPILPNQQLTNIQEKQLEIHLESVNLLITLGTLLYGGIGLYVGLQGAAGRAAARGSRALIYLSMILAGLAILFGFLSYQLVGWMLSKQFFNLDAPIISWPQTAQFWSLMLAAAFFGVFLVSVL